jgi:transcriptional regulator with XRE-family HTH domain
MDPRDKRTKIEGQPADEAGALKPRARSAEHDNVAAFDEIADQLGLTSQGSVPQRWVARVGRLLRTARDRRAMDQGTVASRSELTQSYLSRLENGLLAKRGPTADVLMRCAMAMDCDLEFTLRSRENGEVVAQVSSADPVVYPAFEPQEHEPLPSSPQPKALEVVARGTEYRVHGARLQVFPPDIIEDPDVPAQGARGRVVGYVMRPFKGLKRAPRVKISVTLAKGEAVVIRESSTDSKITRARKSQNPDGRTLRKLPE